MWPEAVWLLLRRRGAGADVRRAMTVVCVLLAVQGTVGGIQYALELPAEIVWVHVAIATLLWVGIVLAAMQVGSPLRAPAPDDGRVRAQPRERAVVGR